MGSTLDFIKKQAAKEREEQLSQKKSTSTLDVIRREAQKEKDTKRKEAEGVSSPNRGGSALPNTQTPAKPQVQEPEKKPEQTRAEGIPGLFARVRERDEMGQGKVESILGGMWDHTKDIGSEIGDRVGDFLFKDDYAEETERINEEAKRLYGSVVSADAPLSMKGDGGRSVFDDLSASKTELDSMTQTLSQLEAEYKRNPSDEVAAQYNQLAERYNQTLAAHNEMYTKYEPQFTAYNDALSAYNEYVTQYGDRITGPVADEYSPYKDQLDALDAEIKSLRNRSAEINRLLNGLSRGAGYTGAGVFDRQRKQYADELAAIEAQVAPLEARRAELVKEGGYLTSDNLLGSAGYALERLAAAGLGFAENVTDFAGTTLYGLGEGITSLGGLVPNPVSEWMGKGYDTLAGDQLTQKYEESIRRRYRPTPVDEKGTAFGQTVAQIMLPIGAGKIIGGLSAAGSLAPAGTLGAANAANASAAATNALFGAHAAGGATAEAHAAGAGHLQSLAYGWSIGAMEVTIERISGAIPGLPDGSRVANVVKRVFSDPRVHAVVSNPVVSRLIGSLGEGGEEALSAIFTPYIQRALYDPNAPLASVEEIGEQALLGGLASLCVSAGIEIPVYVAESIAARNRPAVEVVDAQTIQAIIETGLESPMDTNSYKLAAELKQKQDAGEDLTAREVLGLYQENVAQVNSENAAEQEAADPILEAAREAVGAEVQNSDASQDVLDVLERDDTQPRPEEVALKTAQNAKQSVPYNVMAKDNPVRSAHVQRQESAKKILGYGNEGVKLFNELADTGKVDAFELLTRFDDTYQAGLTGAKVELTSNFQREVYNAGRMDGIALEAKRKPGAILSKSESGFDFTGAPKSITQEQKNFADLFARKMGVKGYWDGQNGNAKYNALYNSRTGGVAFAQDFGIDPELMKKLGSADFMKKVERLESKRENSFVFYLAHEIADHVATNRAPEAMRAFNNAMYNYKQKQAGGENLARSKQMFYASKGVALTTEGAIEEVGADSILDLYDGNEKAFMEAMMRIANGTDEQAKKGARTFRDILNDIIKKLKAWVGKLTGRENAEAKANVEKGITELERLRDMFEQGIAASMKAVEEARNSPNATAKQNIVKVGNEGATFEENGVQHSLKSLRHDITEGRMFDDLVRAKVFSQKEADLLKANLDKLISYMLPNANILDMNEEYTKDNRPFSTYKPNSDPLYVISLDFSTLCRKRLMTQYVIEQLQLRENRPMSAEEQIAIRSMLLDYRRQEKALQVACAMCYVEAARLKAPKQIERFFNDTESIMRKYFAKKDKEFNAKVVEAQKRFKTEHGYDENAPKSAMKSKDQKALNDMSAKMRTDYQPDAKQQAIIDAAVKLPHSKFLTAHNLTELAIDHPEIYDAYTSHIRASTRSKSLEGDVPYYYGDSQGAVTDSFIDSVNAENGMRFDSWSDFQMKHMLDMITAVIDLSVRGSKMHGYTKFPEMVRIFGKTGMMFNLSGVTDGNGFDADGNLVFSDTESIDIKQAIQLRNDFPDTAGLQCIGVSDDHIRALLRADYIDYVIPYHTSGMNATLRRMAGINKWKDYTSTQHATKDPNVKKPANAEKWQVEPVWSEFYVADGKDGTDTMKKTAQRYIDMCHERGLIPKFDAFKTEDGYWKLLVDRKMVNQKTGKLIEQQAVKPIFDFDLIRREIDNEVEQYDSALEQRALKYVVDNFDAVHQRIRDLKKGHPKKSMMKMGNEILQAYAEGSKRNSQSATRAADRFVEQAGDIQYSLVKDKATLDSLNNQEWVKVYRAMYQDETGLYPPMGAIQGGKKVAPVKFDTWYQADEHPELIKFEVPVRFLTGETTGKGQPRKSARFLTDEEIKANRSVLYGTRKANAEITLSSGNKVKFKDLKPKFDLEKADGGTNVPAAYNPYFHTSLSALNDQFDTAYKRPGLVVVEGYIPKSELTSGYRAMYAKDPVGETTWKSGVVANHLKGDKARKVFLSRWFRAGRVVPDAEAAKMIAGVLKGEDLKVPWNVVTPALREALETAGVEIDYDRVYSGTSFEDFQKSANKVGRAEADDGIIKYDLKGVREQFQRKFTGQVTADEFIDISNREKASIGHALKTGYGQIDAGGVRGSVNTADYCYLFDVTRSNGVKITDVVDHNELNIHNDIIGGVYDEERGYHHNAGTTSESGGRGSGYGVKRVAAASETRKSGANDRLAEAEQDGNSGGDQRQISGDSQSEQYSLKGDPNQMEQDLNALRRQRTELQDEIDGAYLDDLPQADIRKLENRLYKLEADIDKLVAQERRAAVRTSMNDILSNLSAYRRSDLESLAEQVSDGNWDDYEDMSRTDLEDALREAIESRELNPLEMQSTKYGLYVRPVSDVQHSLKGEKSMRKEIQRIREEGAKSGKSEAEIESDIMGVVGPEYGELIKTYGQIKRGERAAREIEVPRKTEEDRHVSQTIRTVLEAEATPDAAVPTIQQLIAQGDFSYDVITDKAAMAAAERSIRTKGYETSLAEWLSDVKAGKVSKANTALGWELYNQAATAGDLKTAMTILDGMIKHQRNAAQAVQATRILKKLSPDAQLYGVKRSVDTLQEELNAKYGKKAPDLEIDEALAKKLLEAKTDGERDAAMRELYRDIGRQVPSTFADKWNAWRYLAMLGNPRTHVRNIVGNLGFALPVATKDLTATAIESMVSFVSGGKIERTKGMPSRDLLKAAWADYANVADQIAGSGKYNDAAIQSQAIEEGRVIFKTKLLEKARKANSAALEAEDVWFARPHYAFALAQYCKAHGVTAEQLKSGKALGNARAYAIKEAQKATYRDTNAFSETISQLGRYHGDNVVKKGVSVVMEGILPFRKTPANILVRGLEYSPMGLLKALTLDLVKVKKGEITAAEAIDNASAGLTGTGLLALGVLATAEGLIRGAGGDDEEEKKFEELQGHQSYALELPDGTSVTLDWLAPEVLPMFVGVNLYEMAKDRKGEYKLADILTAVSNVTEPLLEMSCLQSLNDVFDSVGYASTEGLSALPSALASAATSYLTQAFPTILGQAERSSQDVRMTTYTEKNDFLTSDMQYTLGKISAKVPGWDYHQIPYIDAWGRAESTGTTGQNAANNFLNPAYTSQVETSAMEEELLRLYETTGESAVLPSRAQKYFNVDGERKDLTAEEYVKYATEKGQLSYKVVTALTGSAEYRSMTDSERVEAIDMAYDYANAVAKTKVSAYKPDGWIAKAIATNKKTGLRPEKYIPLYMDQKDIESLKDSDGDTISNSKGLLIMQMIYSTKGLTSEQKQALFVDFGVGKTVIHYNPALVNQKLAEMRKK